MKTDLQKRLETKAPSISIQTFWTIDETAGSIHDDCEGMEGEKAEDWQAWTSEVRVTLIHLGNVRTFSEFLGMTWERVWDNPWETNPDISGHELDMTREALSQALAFAECVNHSGLVAEIETALASL